MKLLFFMIFTAFFMPIYYLDNIFMKSSYLLTKILTSYFAENSLMCQR